MIASLGGIFFFLYSCFVVAIGIYMLVLVARFVAAHGRIASALERMAENQSRSGPPL